MRTAKELKRPNEGATPPLPSPPLRGGEGENSLGRATPGGVGGTSLPGANFLDPFGVVRMGREGERGQLTAQCNHRSFAEGWTRSNVPPLPSLTASQQLKRTSEGATPPLPSPPLRGGEGENSLGRATPGGVGGTSLPGANFLDPFGVVRIRRFAAQREMETTARVGGVKK
jgi:hypothetical protein